MPSTHIAKPDPRRDWLPRLAVNEFVCCRWLAALGLAVATTDLITVAGRRVLISSRFDRTGTHPQVTRRHQEDLDAAWANALLGNADAHAKNYAMLLGYRAAARYRLRARGLILSVRRTTRADRARRRP